MGIVKEVKSKSELESLLKEGSKANAVAVIHFWATWCEASKQMDQVFSHIASDFPHALFLRIEAEDQPEISEAYSVSAVPYFVFLKDGKSVATLEGADPSALANKVANLAGSIQPGQSASPASLGLAAGPAVLESIKELSQENGPSTLQRIHNGKENLDQRLEKLISSNPVMLFMKGTPEEPKCGFSKKVIEILTEQNVKFGSFDILSDNEVREGLKKFSSWPTFPQLYCKKELIGGCDIVKAMHDSGELKEILKPHITTQSFELTPALSMRLKTLINSSPVMLFMKGKPEEPKCGFSGKVVEILRAEKVKFGSFDILTDDEVRHGLKVYSNWSSYPQLYVKGELIGGSDIVLEMQKSGELKSVLKSTEESGIEEKLRRLVNGSPVMLFMKGTPEVPRCGFSSKVVNALRGEGVEFGHFDILGDEEVRQGLKEFSNWPTFPQLYCKGELVGGCDIVMELLANGELKTTLLD